MKKIIVIVLVQLIGISSLLAQKNVDQYQIQVDGLGCPFCAYGLEKKFKEFKGIKNVSIKIETGDFSFNYPSSEPLSMTQVVSQVEKAGYTPKKATIIRIDGTKELFPQEEINTNEIAAHKTEFEVSGNCDMCKARIEAAALKHSEVQSAEWNKDTKKLTLEITEKSDIETVGQLVANAGHDNKFKTSKSATYEQLPPCCLYRK